MQLLKQLGLKDTPLQDRICTLLIICLLGFVIVYTTIVYSQLPERIPSHFDAFGNVDAYSDKSTFLLLAFITIIMAIGMMVLGLWPQYFNHHVEITEANKEKQYSLSVSMLRQINLLTTAFMTWMILSISLVAMNKIKEINMGFYLIVLLGSLAYIIGNNIVKSNKYA